MLRRLRPWVWLPLPALAAGLLLAWAASEGRRERRAVEEALRSQAHLLAEGLGASLASASAAQRELAELLTWKLLDNARLAAELEAAGALPPARRRALLDSAGLAALGRLGPGGEVAWWAGGERPPALLAAAAAALAGGRGEEWVWSLDGDDGGLLAAGVGTADGGVLLALASPEASYAYAGRLGVVSVLERLVTSAGLLYLVYRQEPGGSDLAATWDGGAAPAAACGDELRGRPCFEVGLPVAAPAGESAWLRVGLDGAPLARVAGAAVRRTTLVGAVLAALGVLGLAAALAEHARAREREALTRRLGAAERSRQQAERLASAGTLAAGLAHEIRNPLNAVGLAAQRLLRGGALDEAQRSLVERIRLEVGRLEAVLRGFLDLARPAAGERRATDLADVAREVLGTLELEAEARGVALVAELGPAVAAVEPEAVRRAVLNLVRNALEASPRGAAVEVATGAAPTAAGGGGPRARLTVRDRGPGVPAELRERAFEAFVTTKVDGTGLGLALVARVASAHGGSAELAPRPGGGTEAVLEVPRAGVATAPVETAA